MLTLEQEQFEPYKIQLCFHISFEAVWCHVCSLEGFSVLLIKKCS